MPLIPTGRSVQTEAGENAEAHDNDGNRVIVSASDEAIQDYGWDTIWGAASDKYDKGAVDSPGPPPLVRVTTIDCKD